MTTSDHVVETVALTKRYGDVVAVNDLTLRVPRGGVFWTAFWLFERRDVQGATGGG